MTEQPAERTVTVTTDRTDLVTQLAELAEVITDPEALEIGSLFSAIARMHGMAWTKKAAR